MKRLMVMSFLVMGLVSELATDTALATDKFEGIAHSLPQTGNLVLVATGSFHVHPVCGCRIAGGWEDDEWWLYRKLTSDLKDDGNRHKQVVVSTWGELASDLGLEEKGWLAADAASSGATYVLFFETFKTYRWNQPEGRFVRDDYRWELELWDAKARRVLERYRCGASIRDFFGNILGGGEPLRLECPIHG